MVALKESGVKVGAEGEGWSFFPPCAFLRLVPQSYLGVMMNPQVG